MKSQSYILQSQSMKSRSLSSQTTGMNNVNEKCRQTASQTHKTNTKDE